MFIYFNLILLVQVSVANADLKCKNFFTETSSNYEFQYSNDNPLNLGNILSLPFKNEHVNHRMTYNEPPSQFESTDFIPKGFSGEIHLVGRTGHQGGRIYRLFFEGKSLIKTYKKFRNEDHYEKNIKAFDLLQRYQHLLPVRVLRYKKGPAGSTNVLELETVYGRSFLEIIDDSGIPIQVRLKYKELYKSIFNDYIAFAEKTLGVRVIEFKLMGHDALKFTYEDVVVVLNSGNILLNTKTEELVLIDPH